MQMSTALELRAIDSQRYQDFRREVIFGCHKWDPQVGDVNTVCDHVAVLEASQAELLCSLAERLAAETAAAEEALIRRPDLWAELGLGPAMRRGLRYAQSRLPTAGIRVMRFDFHPTMQGWAVSEVNSDVPGGFGEASTMARLAERYVPGVQLARQSRFGRL
jgi:hypothetical protein